MTLNQLAIEVSKYEGKKKQVNIAQIKEIIKVLGCIFANISIFEFMFLCLKMRRNCKD